LLLSHIFNYVFVFFELNYLINVYTVFILSDVGLHQLYMLELFDNGPDGLINI